jgi:hypothetical protein
MRKAGPTKSERVGLFRVGSTGLDGTHGGLVVRVVGIEDWPVARSATA